MKITKITIKKSIFLPVYRQQDLNPHWPTIRFKGLGSMDPEELAKSLLDPAYRRLRKIETQNPRDVADLVGSPSIRKSILVAKKLIEMQP